MTDSKNPDIDLITRWYQSGEPKFDSSDNVYLDTITDIQQGQVKTGAYSVDWSTVSLPANPSAGKWCIRVNTDNDNQMRLYTYNDAEGEWQFTVFRGAIGVTTTVTEITSTGPGTAIDYGSNAPRVKHTMQITGNTNTGTFTSATVNFEVSMDGINYDIQFTLVLHEAGVKIFDIEVPAVKVRYNVTVISVSGDADLDISITST